MKGIWRKCLGLSLGFPLFVAGAGGRAGEPAGPPADRSPPVIARSVPAAAVARPAVSLGRPRAVTLERPRAVAATPTTNIQLTSFHTETTEERQPVRRAQMDDRQPLPPGPGGPFAADQAATDPFGAAYGPAYGVPPGLGVPPPPDDSGWDTHDRFGLGDGVINTYNNRFYFNSEYLLWWIRGNRLPPLVNASGPGPTALMPGLGTETIDGGSSVGRDTHSGYRFRTGYWIDGDHTLGFEGSYFFLGQTTSNFAFGSSGVPVLAVPFTNALDGAPGNLTVAAPGEPGSVASSLSSRLWGYEINLRGNLWGGCNGHIDLIGGYRALGLDDQFTFGTSTMLPSPGGSSVISLQDRFATRNRFYGGQLGVSGEYRWGRWSLDGTFKVALGDTHEQSKIGGNNVINGLSGSGGIFAQPSNFRDDSRNHFSVVPELNLNVGYQVTDHLRAYIGYTFLYWSDVARAGEQVPRVLNPMQFLSGPNLAPQAPLFAFKATDFWAHGLNFGLEFRY